MSTLNWLQHSASMAMDAVLARLDLERGARPYFWVDYQTQPPQAQHSYWDTCDIAGRFVDGLALARIMTGRQDAREAEDLLRRFLWAQQDPTNGLFFNQDDEHAATNAEMSKYIPAAGVLTSGRHADMFCQRAPMLAMITLMQLGDASMRPRLEKMVRGLLAITERDGDALRFPSFRWAETIKPEWLAPVNIPEKWTGYRYAPLTALARYVELTRDPAAIDLALGLARYYMRRGEVPANGKYRANTHSGGVLPVTVGIARLGVALNQLELIEWAQRVYEWTRANMPEFGFLPDGLGLDGFFAGTCETCALADFVHLAVLLGECGAGDTWDDISRLTRNQLIENQYRDDDAIRCTFPGIADDVLAMLHGGFECAAHPNDLFTWAGAEACCIGGGLRALYLTWRSAIDTSAEETRLRLTVSRRTPAAVVTAYEPWAGRIDVRSLRSQRVSVRLSDFATSAAAEVAIDGQPVRPEVSGRHVSLDGIRPRQTVSVRYELPSSTRHYHIAGNNYEADWLGHTVMAMRPPGVRHTLYQRSAWLDERPSDVTDASAADAPILW